ncbi:MAG: glycosyltransferase family 39 protein, partial [Chloroflexota bacterium]
MEETRNEQGGATAPPADAGVASTGDPPGRPIGNWLPSWPVLATVGLLLILLLGAYFRFTGLDWDDTYHLHPDERFLTDTASLLKVTDPITYFKTSESPLNPHNVGKTFYVYGNFPMTATRLVAEGVDSLCLNAGTICDARFIFFDGLQLVGRFLSALLDLVAIVIVYLIGQRLYDWRAGLIGALLMAAAVLPIQQSHFFTMDNWAAAFTTIAMYAAVRAGDSGRQMRWWILFGLALGLTVSSRINLAPLAAMAGVAALVWLIRCATSAGERLGWRYMISANGSRHVTQVVVGLLLAAVISAVVFRLAQPYAFADSQIVRETLTANTGKPPGQLETLVGSIAGFNPLWQANLREIQIMQSPEAVFPPALQWTDRTPILFPFTNMVLWGMGLTAGLAGWLAFSWALYRIVRARPGWLNHVLLVSWVGLYFVFMATRWVKSIRYFLPIYPFLFLLAGWALIELWNRSGPSRLKRVATGVLIMLVIIPTILWANSFVDIYRRPVTRVQASEWIFDNVPTGATLLYESDGTDKELHLPLRHFELYDQSMPLTLFFEMPVNGKVTGLRFNYASDPDAHLVQDEGEQLRIELIDPMTAELLSETSIGVDEPLNLDNQDQEVLTEFDSVPVKAGQRYLLIAETTGAAPIRFGTSQMANEHWDDALPIRLEGRDPYGFYYQGMSEGLIPITHPDSETKRASFYRWLEEAEYIVLSSQRALWSIPRLPLTYPLTNRYYEALFNGELGFELVEQFHADLNIGPLYISDTTGQFGWGRPPEVSWPPPGDLAAEEAFSVYDHPPVWIFAKTEEYSPDKVRRVLGNVDLSNVVAMTPGEASLAGSGLMLESSALQLQRDNGSFNQLFNLDGLLADQPWLAAAVWWLTVVILGWLAFPIAFVALPGLPDRGYPLAKILALLLISYFTWLMGSVRLLPNDLVTLLIGLGLMAVAGLGLLIAHRRSVALFVRSNIQLILAVELVSLALFLVFIIVRLGNPDVWDVIWGGEKPMDLAYFNAVLKSTVFPPYDPWYAGGYINYYYYGFVYIGAITKLLGLVPTVAYNLALPMLASFTGIGAFSVAYNLVASRHIRLRSRNLDTTAGDWSSGALIAKAAAAGLVAAVLVVLLGNLAEITVLVRASYLAGSQDLLHSGVAALDNAVRALDGAINIVIGDVAVPVSTGDWFWSATRAINFEPGEAQPINEFPFFTFLYADLHAHMIALPLTLLALAWAISLVLPGGRYERFGFLTIGQWLIGGLAIGVLRATNTWDFPTYLLIGMIAVAFSVYQVRGRLTWNTVAEAGLQALLLAAVSILLFWPFAESYKVPYNSFSLWPGSYTGLGNYLLIYGLFLFIIVTYVIIELRAWTRNQADQGNSRLKRLIPLLALALVAYAAILVLLLYRGYWIAPVALSLALIAGLLCLRIGMPVERRIVLILIALALSLTLLVEFIVLDGDIGRMNTVFKFYVQVWVLLSVTSAVALIWSWPILSTKVNLRLAWSLALIALVSLAALYPLLATKAKWDTRMSSRAPYTLDGMAFMETTSYADRAYDGRPQIVSLASDYNAIRWMQRNIEGSPVIA